jgi:hypothetical protein
VRGQASAGMLRDAQMHYYCAADEYESGGRALLRQHVLQGLQGLQETYRGRAWPGCTIDGKGAIVEERDWMGWKPDSLKSRISTGEKHRIID